MKIELRKCSSCGVGVPPTPTYFYREVTGLRHECKRCKDTKRYKKELKDLKAQNNVIEVQKRDRVINTKEKDRKLH